MQIENCKLKIENLAGGLRMVPTEPNALLNLKSTPAWLFIHKTTLIRLFSRIDDAKTKICNLHFSIFNFQFRSFLLAVTLLPAVYPLTQAQTVSDKTVASVTNGARANPDLITYSDIVWQLALEPNRPFNAHPSSQDLNQALKLLEDQLLILEEARKLPLAQTAEAQQEFEKAVTDRRNELAQAFRSHARLEERMARVGLTSDQLNAILRDRLTIERYLDFRFRAFVLVSAKEISDRYEKTYRPLRNSGKLVPTLEQAHDAIERELTEEKIAEQIGKFIDDLREQPGTEIVILNPV